MAKLVLTKRPALRAPYLVAGFGGWPNGGNVSTDAVYFLQSTLQAEHIGEITADDLYIYSSPTLASRPVTVIRDGVLESLRFPANNLYACTRPEAEHDLLFLQGIEPDLHWQQFADAIVECLQTFQAPRLYTIGGYLDYAPHTRLPRLSAVVTDAALKDELEPHDIDLTDYEGPTSIQSYLLAACRDHGIEGISLWGGAPSYIQGSYPRLTQSMLRFFQHIWHLDLSLEEIEEQAIELEATLHEQIDANPELADYIRRLEQAYDQAEGPQPDMNTDAIVDEIQQFLRRRRDNPLGNDL
ncbi:MAG: PAC2 family protein [Candidatus Tectomicrobia bacterium]|uniref:PAC2 family protein n=1 Tax=Tectimicrobiota bacterium TaxID=2528274 RepID=A0A937W0T9_UNCTE|nr:PAC2 family protein [Candidatus Tectomicrobia bacterium]